MSEAACPTPHTRVDGPRRRSIEARAAVAAGGPSEALQPGANVRGTPYVVVRQLGQGGMGEVYEVEHGPLGRRCALKILHRNHLGRGDLAARMREEARSLATLRHPNLVDVFDLGVTRDGRPYFAMELLRGRDLRAELARLGALPVPSALELVAQALDGLAAAHDAGIIHRDVKLENLFLCEDGSVKLLDFGVAKVMGSELARTGRGVAVGTPRTMAPEQCSFGELDPRTDLYAAGLVLYELIAGRGPFDELRGADHAMRFAHCMRPPPPPSRFAPQPIPPAVDAAVLQAIAKSPGDRFQTAREMADRLAILRGERRRRRTPVAPPPIDDATTEVMPPRASADADRPCPRLERGPVRPQEGRGTTLAAWAALALAITALCVALRDRGSRADVDPYAGCKIRAAGAFQSTDDDGIPRRSP